jgi:DNA-binding MarR family transcriptional regulator
MSYSGLVPTPKAHDPALTGELRQAVLRLARRLRYQQVDATVTQSQLAVLGTLSKHGPLTPGELAEHEKVQPPSMTRMIGALEQTGYVRRAPHPTDGRQVVVSITETGVALQKAIRRKRDAWLAPRIAELTEQERGVLREAAGILERIAAS